MSCRPVNRASSERCASAAIQAVGSQRTRQRGGHILAGFNGEVVDVGLFVDRSRVVPPSGEITNSLGAFQCAGGQLAFARRASRAAELNSTPDLGPLARRGTPALVLGFSAYRTRHESASYKLFT